MHYNNVIHKFLLIKKDTIPEILVSDCVYLIRCCPYNRWAKCIPAMCLCEHWNQTGPVLCCLPGDTISCHNFLPSIYALHSSHDHPLTSQSHLLLLYTEPAAPAPTVPIANTSADPSRLIYRHSPCLCPFLSTPFISYAHPHSGAPPKLSKVSLYFSS